MELCQTDTPSVTAMKNAIDQRFNGILLNRHAAMTCLDNWNEIEEEKLKGKKEIRLDNQENYTLSNAFNPLTSKSDYLARKYGDKEKGSY